MGMADLSHTQRELVTTAVKMVESGDYLRDFDWVCGRSRGVEFEWALVFTSHHASTARIAGDFQRTDLHAVHELGYITLIRRHDDLFTCVLKQKAFDEYHFRQETPAQLASERAGSFSMGRLLPAREWSSAEKTVIFLTVVLVFVTVATCIAAYLGLPPFRNVFRLEPSPTSAAFTGPVGHIATDTPEPGAPQSEAPSAPVPTPFFTSPPTSAATPRATVATPTHLVLRPTAVDTGTPSASDAIGDRIAFTSYDEEGDLEIYAMTHDGGARWQLTDNRADDSAPAWSPDGAKMAFTRGFGEAPSELRVMDFQPGHPGDQMSWFLTADPTLIMGTRWHPDGAWIVYETGAAAAKNLMYIAPYPGAQPVQLTQAGGEESGADWSPDGRSIAFAAAEGTGMYGCESLHLRVRPFDPQYRDESGRAIDEGYPITDGQGRPISGGCNGGVRWSPEGQRLLFVRRTWDDHFAICLFDLRDKSVSTVLRSADELSLGDWRPDGKTIIFSRKNAQGSGGVHIMNIDEAAHEHRIPNSPDEASFPALWVRSD